MLGYCHWGCKWSQPYGKQYAGTSDTRTELLYDLETPMKHTFKGNDTHVLKKTLSSCGCCISIHKAKKLNQPKYPSAGDQTYKQKGTLQYKDNVILPFFTTQMDFQNNASLREQVRNKKEGYYMISLICMIQKSLTQGRITVVTRH